MLPQIRVLPRRYTAVAVAVFAGILATIGTYLLVCSWEYRVTRIDFESKAKGSLQVLNSDLGDASTFLYTLAAFIGSNRRPVTADEFADFSAELHRRVVGLRDTAWAPRVELANRPAFERAARTDAKGFAIKEFGPRRELVPAAARPRYYPILYIEAGGKKRAVLGFDLISDTHVARTVLHALRLGRPAATPPMDVLTVKQRGAGILSYMPVYHTRPRAGEKTRPVLGFVLGVFDVPVLVEHILAKNSVTSGLELYVFNPRAQGDRRAIYRTPEPGQPAPESRLMRGMYWQSTVRIVDQQLGVIVTPARAPTFLSRSLFGLTTLTVGLTMTTMVVTYLLISLRRTLELEALTASLEATTVTLHEKIEQIKTMSRHDALTGMPNRRLFHERMDDAIRHFRRGAAFSLLFLDLDRFKAVNDTLGHRTGDSLLCEVAQRIGTCIREVDTAARLGGDEFAIILAGASQEADIAIVARRLLERIAQPYAIDGQQISIGVSIGAAIVAHDVTVDTLVAEADLAMYQAKEAGRGTFRLFEKSPRSPNVDEHQSLSR